MSAEDVARERERVRDLMRYYKPIYKHDLGICELVTHVPPSVVCAVEAPPADSKLLAHDPTLTAFAQLGAFRLNCERSFISLMDDGHQYILAEATRSLSIITPDKTDQGDEVYLGSRVLDSVWGVCPNTIQVFTATDASRNLATEHVLANQECYVMNDLSAIEAFKERPYVKGWPYMRFYAEVPIHSPTGHVIGTYCVVDDKPHEGLDSKGLTALTEIASAIMNHLHLVQMQVGLQRSGRMIGRLGMFVEGRSSSSQIQGDSHKSQNKGSLLDGHDSPHKDMISGARTISTTSISPESENLNQSNGPQASPVPVSLKSYDSPSESSAPFRQTSKDRSNYLQSRQRQMSSDSIASKSIAASGIRHLFFRACGLIREAIDVDGVAFIDVSQKLSKDDGSQRALRVDKSNLVELARRPLSKHANSIGPNYKSSNPTLPDGGSPKSTSLRAWSNVLASTEVDPNGIYAAQLPLSQFVVQLLLQRYPQGHIFAYDESGTVIKDNQTPHVDPSGVLTDRSLNSVSPNLGDEEMLASALQSIYPGARSVIFSPLWDPQRQQAFALSLAWTSSPHRTLEVEDSTYLAAFGSCIMSEKSRLDVLRADGAKADFLSSVSHELRSPLHGILASTEALHETSLGAEQDDMIRIVTVCGKILLETVDQILEYSKVRKMTKDPATVKNTLAAFEITDLSLLVENVVDGVLAGHKYRNRWPGLNHTENKEITNDQAILILTIEKRNSWIFRSRIGSWKRILINLVGNALKYTSSGFIHISLRVTPSGLPGGEDLLSLQVEDSGVGISEEYLENELFTPFAQANPLLVGTGLGLSIVKQIAQDLDGTVDLQSEVGYGTTADVAVPVGQLAELPETIASNGLLDLKARCHGLGICLVAFDVIADLEPPTGILTRQQRSMITIKDSFSYLAMEWFGLKVTAAPSLAEADADFTLVLESYIHPTITTLGELPAPLIVFEDTDRSSNLSHPGIFYLTQPRSQSFYEKTVLTVKPTADDMVAPEEARVSLPLRAHSKDRSVSSTVEVLPRYPQREAVVVDDPTLQPEQGDTVLLVEDNPINLKILVNYMKRAKRNYQTANNGLEAVEAYKINHSAINLIFMDISMPVMDGLTATQHIRQFEQEQSLPRTRVVALTCFSSDEYQKEAFESGIDMFLVKPVPMKNLQPILDLDPIVTVHFNHNPEK